MSGLQQPGTQAVQRVSREAGGPLRAGCEETWAEGGVGGWAQQLAGA